MDKVDLDNDSISTKDIIVGDELLVVTSIIHKCIKWKNT
jgi:hypothetical protein